MASHKAIVSGLSGRYAVALFDLAEEAGALDAVEADLAKLTAAMHESDDFRRVLTSPLVGRAQKKSAVLAVAEKLALDTLASKFLGVMALNGRLGVLGPTIKDFNRLLSAHRGEVTAEVKSAEALSDKQFDALKKSLKLAMGRDVAIEAQVDESLLGGLIVKVGSRMVDSSLKTKLDNLKVAMKGVQ